jgi:hypothetical protein
MTDCPATLKRVGQGGAVKGFPKAPGSNYNHTMVEAGQGIDLEMKPLAR